ncbi:MAG: DNA gyrase inhibitor YacG [Betaproteobacteria bacterium]
MPAPRTVRCPQCGKLVEWTAASTFRPFCSKRCKEIDLGAWASESYRIPVVDDEDEDGKRDEERD